MRSVLTRVGTAFAVAAVLTGCGGGGGTAPQASEGLTAAEACGGFAKDASAAAALKAVLGGERFEDNLSKPEKALDRLRDDAAAPWADSYRPQPVTYCGLQAAEEVSRNLKIQVNAVGKGPYLDPELAKSVTSYDTGVEAFSSSTLGKLFFSCRLKAPALPIVVETAVWGPADVEKTDEEQRTHLITLANAAARDVSAKLGCEGDGLVTGVPKRAAKSS
ncbi:hypothetical protein EDD98_1627 [Streptomyces sp. PanSC19]|uniref:hypothetical protein n=1 Tax=Streptomyces sp. PanSC19 TaxID=1520455 RepID=UPI000F9FA9C3|nr:hypothetical protein [Streptomyces sp. PanSC19]ROQ32635.1 hypothetical protein EDD98_1627 [Streptomyces sp. PanSC19]